MCPKKVQAAEVKIEWAESYRAGHAPLGQGRCARLRNNSERRIMGKRGLARDRRQVVVVGSESTGYI